MALLEVLTDPDVLALLTSAAGIVCQPAAKWTRPGELLSPHRDGWPRTR
jgi:hypothetical protein